MTEHSLKELLRQQEIAQSNLKVAERAFNEASTRVYKKRYAECGYAGKLVKTEKYLDGVLIVQAEFWSDGKLWRLLGNKIRKDGQPSEGAPISIYVKDILSVEDRLS